MIENPGQTARKNAVRDLILGVVFFILLSVVLFGVVFGIPLTGIPKLNEVNTATVSFDGKTVEVDLEYSYHFDVDVLSETFTKFKGQDGEQIEKTFMRGKLKTYVSDVSSKFSVLDIYGEKRTDLNAAILEYAREKFAEFGIIIDSINLSRIELDTQTAEAIQKKINKQQELEELKLEAQKAEVEAEKLLVEKQAQADAEILKAQAEADAELIKAQAQAEANRLISESLTSELLQLEKIQKWSGEVPMVQGDSTPILDLK